MSQLAVRNTKLEELIREAGVTSAVAHWVAGTVPHPRTVLYLAEVLVRQPHLV